MDASRFLFAESERERYSGHLNLCEIDLEGQRRLREANVLVVGCGGLGSPVALYLAAAGVGHIGLVDSDTVSLSNLQRQIIHATEDIGRPKVVSASESISRINPCVRVSVHNLMLGPENAADIVKDYDVVVDCTDSLDSRLLVNDTCVSLGCPYVFGSVARFSGMLFTYKPGHSDYRSIFDVDAEDGGSVSCACGGVFNAVVGVVGTLQAAEALKLVVGTGDLLLDCLLTVDLLNMQFQKYPVS